MNSKLVAPAKINLTLHVTGKRADGYHLLDSLVVFADQGDVLTFVETGDLTLVVNGPFADGVPTDGRNLVLQTAEMLRPNGRGARITLTKHLPHGGGIGGGSSDAAAAARGLADLWGVAPLTEGQLLTLGADVPVCARAPRPMIMRGIGEELAPALPLPRLWCLLVNPGAHVPTGDVFRHLSAHGRTDNAAMTPRGGNFIDWLRAQRNDLAPATAALVPEVASLLYALAELPEALHSNMSGSGSTCWALFETEKLAREAAGLFPSCWTMVTPIGG